MSQQKPEQDISELVGAANSAVRQQQENSAALAAAVPQQSRIKQILAIALLIAFASVAWVQYPKISEPFGRSDPNESAEVAEADLKAIAMMIQTFRTSQGEYPATLDQVRLPEFLATFVAEQKIVYRKTDAAYVLDWKLPRWHAMLNGETGKVEITPTSNGK